MIGTPDEVIERLRYYEELGVDEFSFWCDNSLPHEEKKKSLELFIKRSCRPSRTGHERRADASPGRCGSRAHCAPNAMNARSAAETRNTARPRTVGPCAASLTHPSSPPARLPGAPGREPRQTRLAWARHRRTRAVGSAPR